MINSATIPPADLLAQLGELINATQSVSADAEKWRELGQLLMSMGYGPNISSISPSAIACLMPNARDVTRIVAASQEVPAPAAPKSATGKRRIITDEDIRIIRHAYQDDGLSVKAIIGRYGYSKSTVERYAHAVV